MLKGLDHGIKRRRTVIAALASAAVPSIAMSQTVRPPRRIGFLGLGSAQVDGIFLVSFRAGMLDLGWVEGRDYSIESRHADGVPQAGPALAASLVANRPDLLLAPGDGVALLLRQATPSIPIVFGVAMDPVGAGLAAGLRQPGGNSTGLTTMATELWPKRLQLLKEVVPRAAHIGILFSATEQGSLSQARAIEATAPQLGLRVTRFEMRQPTDIDPTFKRAASLDVHAWSVPFDAISLSNIRAIADHLIRLRAPSMFAGAAYAKAGGLMSFGASFSDNMRRAAAHVDKILKGANPGDLPIEQPTRFELVVNMKTARAIGVSLRDSFMVGVDQVIE
jgi:putative ABC transport system substrate-binding protein